MSVSGEACVRRCLCIVLRQDKTLRYAFFCGGRVYGDGHGFREAICKRYIWTYVSLDRGVGCTAVMEENKVGVR